jgi:hypothetical protein
MRAAMDRYYAVTIAKYARDLAIQVIQRIAMLGKNDDLALPAGSIMHLGIILKNFRQFVPLSVLP